MKTIRWNLTKNQKLQSERGITFEVILDGIKEGHLLDDYEHPDKVRYANQRILVVKIENYAYLVTYVETELEIFLKTIIPSRKATKKYILNED